ncbi:EpsG family protein [Agathobacter sp.]
MVYIVLIFICVILAILASKYVFYYSDNKKIYLFQFLSLCCVVFIAGFRGINVGTDTSGTYLEIYKIAQVNLGSIRDFGYGVLNLVSYKIWNNYNFLLLIVSIIMYSLIFIRIYKSSEIPWFSVFLFFTTNFFFVSMNMVRQSISIAIFVYIFPMIHSRKKSDIVKTWILILVGILMHSSSIIIIPAYFVIRYFKLTPKRALLITILNCLFYGTFDKIVITLLYRVSYFRKYFAWYFNSSYNSGKISVWGILIPLTIGIFWVFLYYSNSESRDKLCFNDLGLCMLIAVNLMLYSGKIPLIDRIALYFTSQVIILIPNTVGEIKNRKNQFIFKIIILTSYFSYMYITIFLQRQEGVLPYTNILFGG